MDILPIILALGLIGVLIFFFFMTRKMQGLTTSKSKYKNASLFAFGAGVFAFFLAIISLAFQSTLNGIIPSLRGPRGAEYVLVHRFLGIYGYTGLLIILGIVLFVKAKSLKKKSEQEKEDK